MWHPKKHLAEIFRRPAHNESVIDGLRAIAIVLVVCFHSFFFSQYVFSEKSAYLSFVESVPALLNWVWQGDKGVDIFFVISGFLIGRILIMQTLEKGNSDLRGFFIKRILRIVPLYLLALAAFSIGNDNAVHFWRNLLFINNFTPIEELFIPWSWSITIEMQFYLTCPLIIFLVVGRLRHVVGVLALLVVVAALVRLILLGLHQDYYQNSLLDIYLSGNEALALGYLDTLYINLYSRAGPLLSGLLAAYICVAHADRLQHWLGARPWVSHLLVLGSLATIVGIFFHPTHLPTNHADWNAEQNFYYLALARNFLGLAVAILVVLCVLTIPAANIVRGFLSSRLWFPISQTSYCIYLFHVPFLFLAYFLVVGVEPVLTLSLFELIPIAVLTLVFTFVFGVLTFVAIERPMIQTYGWIRGKGARA